MYAHMYVGASELTNVRVLMTTIKVLNGEKKILIHCLNQMRENWDVLIKPP